MHPLLKVWMGGPQDEVLLYMDVEEDKEVAKFSCKDICGSV